MTALLLPVFIAGLASFLAPCTLPIIPGFLGLVSGLSLSELATESKSTVRNKAIKGALAFGFGFSVAYTFLGLFSTSFVDLISFLRPGSSRIAGLLIIVFGLMQLGRVQIPYYRGIKKPVSLACIPGSLQLSILGAFFGICWAPCIGPVLATVLLLATTTGDSWKGAILLLVFSIGLMLPFVFVAVFIQQAVKGIAKYVVYARILSHAIGIILIIWGLFLLFNHVSFILWLTDKLFNWLPKSQINRFL